MARFFIEHYNAKFKRQIEGISPEAESLLLAHDWAGQRARTAQRHRARHDPGRHRLHPTGQSADRGAGRGSVDGATAGAASALSGGDAMSLVEQERRLLVQALEKTGGNQTQAARLLRITRDTLRYKMKKFNLR